MNTFIRILTEFNNYYKKYMYIIIPTLTIILNIYDFLFKSKSQYYKIGNSVIICSLIIVLIRYLHSNRNDLFCLCATISLTYISILMFATKRIDFHPVVAFFLIGLFVLMMIVTFAVRIKY